MGRCKTEEDLVQLASECHIGTSGPTTGDGTARPDRLMPTPWASSIRSSRRRTSIGSTSATSGCWKITCGPLSGSDETAIEAVRTLVATEPGIALAEVRRRIPRAAADLLHTMMAAGVVYVDLHRAPLAEPDRVALFRDAETCAAHRVMTETRARGPFDRPPMVELAIGAAITWDGRPWTIANIGETTTGLLGEGGVFLELPNAVVQALVSEGKLVGIVAAGQSTLSAEGQARFAKANLADLREAQRRYEIIRPRLRGEATRVEGAPERTVRHWTARWRQAEQIHGCGLVGLLPRLAESGNRRRKLPETTVVLMQDVIQREYETLTQKSKTAVHGALVRACAERGLEAPSYRTFVGEVNRRPREAQWLDGEAVAPRIPCNRSVGS